MPHGFLERLRDIGICAVSNLDSSPRMENPMEKQMENEMETLGPFNGYLGVYRDITTIMENHMEKNVEMEWKLGSCSLVAN